MADINFVRKTQLEKTKDVFMVAKKQKKVYLLFCMYQS